MHLIGDVKDKDVVIIDDMIDTAGTLVAGRRGRASARARGACSPAASTPCSPARPSSASTSSPLEELVVTNTIPLPPEKRLPKFTVLSVAPLLAEAIRRIHDEESVSTLFV